MRRQFLQVFNEILFHIFHTFPIVKQKIDIIEMADFPG